VKPHAGLPVIQHGQLEGARRAVILLHGRGSSAAEIARVAPRLAEDDTVILAPQAAGHSWYPNRFLAPLAMNEPFLSSAVAVVEGLLARLAAVGVPEERVALAGFSQGACLSLEMLWRRPSRLLAVAAWSGARPGTLEPRALPASLASVPVLLSCSEEDAHIPAEHVRFTAAELRARGAAVTERLRPGGDHALQPEDLAWLLAHVRGAAAD
jgi:predicted esterase